MSETNKNRMYLVIAFLAGIAIAALVFFLWMRQHPGAAQQARPAGAGSGGQIDLAETFPSWNADSASLKELVDFVAAATDEKSPDYLEPADRIAVFDMDGTILCEKAPVYIDYCLTMYRVLDDPEYKAIAEEQAAMQQVRDHAYSEGATFHPEGITKDDLVASAFAGMTPEEFRDYVVDFADHTEAVGFEGMTYGESFYKPMIEVVKFLQASDFDVWIVSACEREIGKRPVLAFGNSSGDYSMLNYAEGNPDHTGMGFFVVCDDTGREYGSDEKVAEYYDEVEKEGWTPFSMADDWKTIYGDDVEKTELPGAEAEELPNAS